MRSSIQRLNDYKRIKKGRKIALLGDMLELGKKTKFYHKKLSYSLNKSDIDKIFFYGKNMKTTYKNLNNHKRGSLLNNLNNAQLYFANYLKDNDIFMIKGSNATGLFKLANIINK